MRDRGDKTGGTFVKTMQFRRIEAQDIVWFVLIVALMEEIS